MYSDIRKFCPHLNPLSISNDFERAAISAVREKFPLCRIKLMLLSFNNKIKKRFIEENLMVNYNRVPVFASKTWMIIALAFLYFMMI